MRLAGRGFHGGGLAIDELVAVRRCRTDHALVANPSRTRQNRGVDGELRLVLRLLFFDVGVGKDLHPGAGALDDQHLVPRRNDGHLLRLSVRRNINVGNLQHGRPHGIRGRSVLLG